MGEAREWWANDRIKVVGDVAFITLSRGQEAIIDAVDVPLVEKYTWHVQGYRGKGFYAQSKAGRRRCPATWLHRLLLQPEINASPARVSVDHIDGNGLNCRRYNLRIATVSQNQMNQRLSRLSTTGLKGVSKVPGHKYQASIRIGGKKTHLGRFDTAEKAHEAYCAAASKHFGEFARFE